MQKISCIRITRKKNTTVFCLAVAIVLLLINSSVLSAIHVPFLVELSDDSLRYTFFFDEPTLGLVQMQNRSYTTIDMNECFSYAQPGFPILPLYRASLLLPKGRSVEDIQVTYRNPQTLATNVVNHPILPEQDFIRIGMDEPQSFVMNDTVYGSPTPVFTNLFDNDGIGYCRGYAILTIILHPVQYIPVAGILTYYPEMMITLQLDESEEHILTDMSSLLRESRSDEDLIREMVANPSILSTYEGLESGTPDEGMHTTQNTTLNQNPSEMGTLDNGYQGGLCSPAERYQYVIITSQSLKDTTGYAFNWSRLITHRKTFNHVNGTIVTVQEIDTCPDYWNTTVTFNDSQAHIREFCKDAYLDWDTEYLLLGGDWDDIISHQIVPYRLFTDREETQTYNTMACDKYYSNLDGTWYYESQGIWGGGRNSGVNDYYAELYVGRIAAYNASMVSNAVQKIIWYDLSAPDAWLSEASFLGGNLGWTVTSKQYMEELRLGTDTYRTFTGFEEWNPTHPETPLDTSERNYHADVGSTYKTFFSNSIEDDNASIVNHLDHSDWNSPFGLTNWQTRYNTKPFFGYSQGCLAGRFHAGDAGSEQLMCRYPERHAFATVLNTGYGYASSTSSDGPSQYIQCYFYDYFFNNQSNDTANWQLGKAHAYTHEKMSARIDFSSHAWCYAWYSAHLFGDPCQTLRLHNAENNEITIDGENPSNESPIVPLNTTYLTVTIQHLQGHPLNYTLRTVPHIGNRSGNTLTNESVSCAISGLIPSTTYTWYVNVSDGTHWKNCSFWFITENLDTAPPEISFIQYISSNPLDLEPIIGWENISCTIIDQTNVQFVSITIMYPNTTCINVTMNQKTDLNTYYYNTTFTDYGNFSFVIWANDTNNNQASSDIYSFILPPNWDVTNDRTCSIEDFITTANRYGEQGTPGWIREDIDNDGGVFVFDLVVLSNHFLRSW